MQNKIIIFFFTLLINIFFCLNISANEQFTFDVSELEISDNGNRIKGFNRGIITSDDGLEIQADIFDYNKITNILYVSGDVKVEDKIKNFIISAENITYLKNENKIISENNSKIVDNEGRTINANKISYNSIENTFNATGDVESRR
jgi:LPS-assembly protein